MRILSLLILSQFFVACLMTPQPAQNSRKVHPAISDLDNLEMLLLNDQQSIYQNNRKLSSTDNIHLGMQKNRVKRSLGLPSQVEVAGNPKYGNERWVYVRSVPTLDGYYKEKKVIYFEGGSVVGWESH